MEDSKFIHGLENNDISLIKTVPKSDLHNHGDLGGSLSCFEKEIGKRLIKPPDSFSTFIEFQSYINTVLDSYLSTYHGANSAKRGTIEQAKDDGVTLLEISIHNGFDYVYKGREEDLKKFINHVKNEIYPNLILIPSLGFSRGQVTKEIEDSIKRNIDTGYFKSIDLYGANEKGDDHIKYRNIFLYAKSKGLRLKAHVGEYGSAEDIRKAVETLELDEVQHGISAVDSEEVMKWLSINKIQLNVCPTSNIKLGIVKDIRDYPIKKLVQNGIKVTLNTDDYLVFKSSVSDEYLKLYNAEVLNAHELNEIRKTGLESIRNYKI